MNHILVIDDDDVARELMCSTLNAAGYKAFELRSPIGATRIILENDVTAVVLDVLMPAMRGDRLAKLLRGNPRFARLGIVLVSGDADVHLESLAREVGADAIVDKRVIKHELATAVRTAINAKARPKSSA